MLRQIRAASKSGLALFFIVPLIVAFAVWGLNDIFSGGLRNNVVAVGQTGISMTELRSDVELALQRRASETGVIMTMEEARDSGIVDEAIARMASIATYVETGRDLSLQVSDDLIRQLYREIDAFRNPVTNEFDPNRALQVLASNNISDVQFEQQLRYQLMQEQIGAAAAAGLRPPTNLRAMREAFLAETRQVSFAVIPASAEVNIGEPGEDELAEFFAARSAEFADPERRDISLIRLSVDRFAKAVEIEDEDVRTLYEAELSALGASDLRDLTILTFQDENLGASIRQRLAEGQPPELIAEEVAGVTLTTRDNVAADDIRDARLREQATALNAGGVSEVYESGAGFQIVYVSRLVESEPPTFESLAPGLIEELRQERAADALFSALTSFEQARDQGATLASAAEKAGIDVIRLQGVDRRGVTSAGELAFSDPAANEILSRAFDQVLQLETETVDLDDNGYFALEVSAIVPSRERSLEEVRPFVEEAWRGVKTFEARRNLAQSIEQRLQNNAALSELVAEFPQVNFGRGEFSRLLPRTEGISASAAAAAFGIMSGQTTITAEPGGAVAVLRIDGVGSADDLVAAFGENIEAQLADEMSTDLAVSLIGSLQRQFEVQTNRTNVNRALGLSDPT